MRKCSGCDAIYRISFRKNSRSHFAQIQCEWEFRIFDWRRDFKLSLRVAVTKKSGEPPRFGFVAVHGKRVVTASARMRDVISAAAERAFVPSVVKIKAQRRVRFDRGLQTHWRLPRAITHAGDAFAVRAGRVQRHAMTVASDGETVADKSARFNLQSFERRINVTHRAAAAGFFAEDVPRFERGAKFNLQITLFQIADARETKFKV